MHATRLRAVMAALALVAMLVAGCGRAEPPPGPATAAPTTAPTTATATATPAASAGRVLASATPDAARAMTHLRALAGEIGIRASTTEGERRAAEYIRQQLEAAGYRVALERFDVQATLGGSAAVRSADGAELPATPMAGSPDGTASGPLVAAGLGRAGDYAGVAARGAVVLVDRGEVTFAEKARAAQEAGAVALVVVNNQPEPFRGDLGSEPVGIPSAGLAGADGPAARALLGQRVSVSVQTTRVSGPSQNVVGRPSDAPCVAYLGAHYDSVPAGPGANDNGSGTSLLLELARARRIEGLCVIAFGSEEVGLFGSRAFVREHDVKGARFMLNFDMVAKVTQPALIGDPDLAARVKGLPAASAFTLRSTASIGPNASSDHAPFIAAGVPALMFYSGNDPFIHTAQDDVANTAQADLAKFLELAVALLDDLFKR